MRHGLGIYPLSAPLKNTADRTFNAVDSYGGDALPAQPETLTERGMDSLPYQSKPDDVLCNILLPGFGRNSTNTLERTVDEMIADNTQSGCWGAPRVLRAARASLSHGVYSVVEPGAH